ncbi:MAG TPA: hypothetical protein VF261_03040 [Candidatus Saccharimonadales bacterium]
MSNPYAVDAYYKAQSLAYWSFIGLLIPLLGVILGALSRSRLRSLVSNDPDERAELEHVWRVASWGFGLSVTLLVLEIIAGIVWGILIGITLAELQGN